MARVAMVSGAGRGLGAAITEKLLADGWHVSVGLRDQSQADRFKAAGDAISVHAFDATRPETAAAWTEATVALRGLGLRLPWDVEWEYVARSGTVTVWPFGDDPQSLEGHANVSDLAAKQNGVTFSLTPRLAPFDDGPAKQALLAAAAFAATRDR